jgi:hypothetical protein
VIDPSYVIAGDDAGLRRLSEICGRTLAFVVETAGGCAFFSCFENGRLQRKIEGVDRAVTLTGNSLPEEEGVDISGYYLDETEALATAFGLTGVACAPLVQTAIAVAFVDQTNFDLREKDTPPLAAKVATKPWWKFW